MKHIAQKNERKRNISPDVAAIRDIFVRIESAFQRRYPKITRLEMAKMIAGEGERCSVRTLIGYASGENWPHIRILKAICRVTGASLDEIVLGERRAMATERIEDAVVMLDAAYKNLLEGTQLNIASLTPDKIELRKIINRLSDDDVRLTLENVRRLHVK